MNTSDSTTVIILTKDQFTIIDIADVDLADFSWHTHHSHGKYYACGSTAEIRYLHRVILERSIGRKLLPDEEPDHINGDSLDNRRSNLRVSNHQENQWNMKKHSDGTSIYKGVSYDKKNGTWKAQIRVGGKNKNLGRYNTEQEAAIIYNHTASEYFGEHGFINDIIGWQVIFPEKLHSSFGENHIKAKLTHRDVEQIRQRYAEGNITYAALAKMYCVTKSTIGKIVNRKHWHIEASELEGDQ